MHTDTSSTVDMDFVFAAAEAIQDARIAKDEVATDKICTRCHTAKPISDFYGRQTKCKACHKAQVQNRQHANAVPTVYAIVIDCKVVYVGSTYKLSLAKRLEAHMSRANTGGTSRIAQRLRDALRTGQVPSIVCLEAMPGATKSSLLKQEKVWIRRFSRLTNNSLYQVRSVPVL